MSYGRIDFGDLISQLRISKGYSQKIVADKLGIDISLLSKIEHGERQVQGHMLKPLSELFNLNYKELQIQFLNQKIESEFGEEPFFKESLEHYLKSTH
ncbi:MAG: Helix-turn-helix domain [Bacteroidota bacterium]|jgi:transcriptional regulator with XRE-family HTH domain